MAWVEKQTKTRRERSYQYIIEMKSYEIMVNGYEWFFYSCNSHTNLYVTVEKTAKRVILKLNFLNKLFHLPLLLRRKINFLNGTFFHSSLSLKHTWEKSDP